MDDAILNSSPNSGVGPLADELHYIH